MSRLSLGRLLKDAREAANVSREGAAHELQCDLSKISRIETGKSTPPHSDVRLLMRLYSVSEEKREEIERMAKDARRRSRHSNRIPDWARMYLSLEEDAQSLRNFETELIPGILQTAGYARAVAAATEGGIHERDLEEFVAARQARQQRLVGSKTQLWAVLNESSLNRMVGGVEVMREQLGRLVELSELPNINLYLLPYSSGAHPAMGTSFILLELESTKMVYLEDLTSADYLDTTEQVELYGRIFDRLLGDSLNAADTMHAIKSHPRP